MMYRKYPNLLRGTHQALKIHEIFRSTTLKFDIPIRNYEEYTSLSIVSYSHINSTQFFFLLMHLIEPQSMATFS